MLEELGVAKVFTPGATTGEITGWVAERVRRPVLTARAGLSSGRSTSSTIRTRCPLCRASRNRIRRRGDPPRQQRSARAEGHRRHPEADLVEQPGVVELADQVAAADDPDVPVARGRDQLVVHRSDVAAHVVDVDPGDAGQVAVAEHPDRPVVVELLPLLGVLGEVPVERPLVRRGAHHQRPDPADEVVPAAVVLAVGHLEEPVEGVVLVGDEAVERASGEVHDPGHVRRR